MPKGLAIDILKFSKGLGKPGAPAPAPAAAPSDDDMGKTAAASDFLDAIKAGDPARVASAFASMSELCKGGSEPDSDDTDAVGKG